MLQWLHLGDYSDGWKVPFGPPSLSATWDLCRRGSFCSLFGDTVLKRRRGVRVQLQRLNPVETLG
jgi:hypothetical protein